MLLRLRGATGYPREGRGERAGHSNALKLVVFIITLKAKIDPCHLLLSCGNLRVRRTKCNKVGTTPEMAVDWNHHPHRRVRRSYRAWQKFRLARRVMTILCTAIVLALVAVRIVAHLRHGEPIEQAFIIAVGIALLAALLVPRLLVTLGWNLLWRLKRHDWQ
ncbi:hypothetical protein SH611_07435 [Geminicoccaceae bacterium 1502E]|nr:hypothetical protein [Geminicoccaceae bacterium 1502E]